MRRIILLFWMAIVAYALWMLTPRSTPPRLVPTTLTTTTRPTGGSDSEHITWLKRLGFVPTDADIRDLWLASKTSWWGKRLDPKAFWKDRVLWRDSWAMATANACGREYPPVPQDDPAIPYDDDRRPTYTPQEGYSIPYVSSSRERRFWEVFDRTHPRPPEVIDAYQTSDIQHRREDVLFFGCPPEALTEEAIRWARVLKWRAEYRADLALPQGEREMMTNYLFGKVAVDPKLITEPLTEVQLKAAKAWKVAYLQRLRREKTDESYINAYLKAWNLTPAEVFAESTPQ